MDQNPTGGQDQGTQATTAQDTTGQAPAVQATDTTAKLYATRAECEANKSQLDFCTLGAGR